MNEPISADPFKLDETDYASALREISDCSPSEDPPPEPRHPLRNQPSIAAICDLLSNTLEELWISRRPDGGMHDDAYFYFDEGLRLRPEVVAKLVLDCIRKNPRLLEE